MHKDVTDKNKSIQTIPKGVWESSPPVKRDNSGKSSSKTDLQGNGYPKGHEVTKK